MCKGEMFAVLQTCIIGESFEACGVGYDPEDSLDTYHASDFLDDVDEEDVTGTFSGPEQFLEDLCSSSVGRVYGTLRSMRKSWELSRSILSRHESEVAWRLWDLGREAAAAYIDEYFGCGDAKDFLERGERLFGVTVQSSSPK